MNGGRRNGDDRRTAAGTALVVFGAEYVSQHLSGAIHVPVYFEDFFVHKLLLH